jgi:methylase of polypeptide subunit release factors
MNADACLSSCKQSKVLLSQEESIDFVESSFREFGRIADTQPCSFGGLSAEARSTSCSGGPFHIILSNPPYLDESRAAFDADARSSDPSTAIFASHQGMGAYQDLAANTALFSVAEAPARNVASEPPSVILANPPHGLLAACGAIFLEVPHGKASTVASCMLGGAHSPLDCSTTAQHAAASQGELVDVKLLRDSRGLERCLVMSRR